MREEDLRKQVKVTTKCVDWLDKRIDQFLDKAPHPLSEINNNYYHQLLEQKRRLIVDAENALVHLKEKEFERILDTEEVRMYKFIQYKEHCNFIYL